ncbi:MAG: MFS transporter, partial [Candidatus Aminicenantes bacterium]|nr:MFS transporter [Candidatus Aminicenantes bacterium]
MCIRDRTLAHLVRPWFILILGFLLGMAQAFDAPARQALVAELVPLEDLTNAIALNSTMVNIAFFLGPAFSGIIYTYLGPAFCFLINGISYLAVIVALFLMKLSPLKKIESSNSAIDDLKQGIKYLKSQPLILALIATVGLLSLFGSGSLTLLPAWAVRILHGDARTNGWLQSARGLGALVAALFIASLGRFSFRGRLLTIGAFSLPLLMLIFSFSSHLGLSLITLFTVGIAIIIVANLANSLVQSLVDYSMRGRIMGLYSLSFFGFMPLGSLLTGQIASALGERQTILINSCFLFLFLTIVWLLAPKIKKL